MVEIPYGLTILCVSLLWLLARAWVWKRQRGIQLKRELALGLVYICLIVVVRVTFFPFFKVDGRVQPLLFEAAKMLPPRINWVPLVNLLDYPDPREAVLNVAGNTLLFLPVGIVWPAVFRELDRHWKVIAAGVGFSLCIEILQLPFYDRVTDVDDLILNMFGFVVGYLLYLLAKAIRKHRRKHNESV